MYFKFPAFISRFSYYCGLGYGWVEKLQCKWFVVGQFGPYNQDFGYITVRDGAHMFYWMFYTTAPVKEYTERPLIVWLQGGPGGSSTGIGNFEILGPLDLSLQERNHTWVTTFMKLRFMS
jgi:hypothetical protein